MELRWILIGIAVLVIIAVVADGLRRQRARKAPPPVAPVRNAARDDADFNPELPGKVRVVRREPRVGNTGAQAAVGTAPAGVSPPTLVEPAPPPEPRIEQVDMFGDVEIPASQPAPAREIRERGELPRREPQGARASASAAGKPAEKPKKPAPEEVIVVHVMSGASRIDGKALLQAALDCGLRFGEYNIFHRYESGAHDAAAMFSMANAVEPGVFDLDGMEAQSFVGVSFFLMLPGPANSRQALDTMVEAARRLAAAVAGELHDQQHSVLTPQTVEHLRQRVMEYERRRLAQQLANG